MRKKGFTLLELLVVIAMMSLLTALLLPALGRARTLTRRRMCMAKLRAIGIGAAMYAAEFNNEVPVCFRNIQPASPRPWRSWRANLLDYCDGYAVFNCPSVRADGSGSTVFHANEELISQDYFGTADAGSYGVFYQFSLPDYETPTSMGSTERGHPVWSNSFSILPGAAWRDPAGTVYVADACFTQGPITYPSMDYKGLGTSHIIPPSSPEYFTDTEKIRRFANRHGNTNCLFLDGRVSGYDTEALEAMKAGESDCVWDVE